MHQHHHSQLYLNQEVLVWFPGKLPLQTPEFTPRTCFTLKVNVPPPGRIQMDIHVMYSAYWNRSFAFQPETSKYREQLVCVQLCESTLCTTAYAELFSPVLLPCKLDPAALTPAEGKERNKVKSKRHPPQAALPSWERKHKALSRKEANTRLTNVLWTSSFRFVTGDELQNYSCGCFGNPKSRLETQTHNPPPVPTNSCTLWFQQLRKQNKVQFTSVPSGSRRISWQFEILLWNCSYKEANSPTAKGNCGQSLVGSCHLRKCILNLREKKSL